MWPTNSIVTKEKTIHQYNIGIVGAGGMTLATFAKGDIITPPSTGILYDVPHSGLVKRWHIKNVANVFWVKTGAPMRLKSHLDAILFNLIIDGAEAAFSAVGKYFDIFIPNPVTQIIYRDIMAGISHSASDFMTTPIETLAPSDVGTYAINISCTFIGSHL